MTWFSYHTTESVLLSEESKASIKINYYTSNKIMLVYRQI